MKTMEMALVIGAGTKEDRNATILQREQPKKQMVQAAKRLAVYMDLMKKQEGK